MEQSRMSLGRLEAMFPNALLFLYFAQLVGAGWAVEDAIGEITPGDREEARCLRYDLLAEWALAMKDWQRS